MIVFPSCGTMVASEALDKMDKMDKRHQETIRLCLKKYTPEQCVALHPPKCKEIKIETK